MKVSRGKAFGMAQFDVTHKMMLVIPLLLAVSLSLFRGVEAQECSDLNDDIDGPYWNEVSNCTSCVTSGCGYCLSTLRCVSKDKKKRGTPCPQLIDAKADCPVRPTCSNFKACGDCAASEECAWCASENRCTSVAEIFDTDCRGTVWSPPCPDSFVGGIKRGVYHFFFCMRTMHAYLLNLSLFAGLFFFLMVSPFIPTHNSQSCYWQLHC